MLARNGVSHKPPGVGLAAQQCGGDGTYPQDGRDQRGLLGERVLAADMDWSTPKQLVPERNSYMMLARAPWNSGIRVQLSQTTSRGRR
jgi:hypothetical protein